MSSLSRKVHILQVRVSRYVFTELVHRLDTYSLFTEPVNEDEVPDYREVIKSPMDFGTMRTKVENGVYGKGSDAVVGFYNDFMLVFDNCALYNDEDGEVGLEAARLFGLVPEVFAAACLSASGKQKKPKAKVPSSALI